MSSTIKRKNMKVCSCDSSPVDLNKKSFGTIFRWKVFANMHNRWQKSFSPPWTRKICLNYQRHTYAWRIITKSQSYGELIREWAADLLPQRPSKLKSSYRWWVRWHIIYKNVATLASMHLEDNSDFCSISLMCCSLHVWFSVAGLLSLSRVHAHSEHYVCYVIVW